MPKQRESGEPGLESHPPQNKESLIIQSHVNTSFLQTLVFKQSKGQPDGGHLINHVIQFKSSTSICTPLKGMKCHPCHQVEWKSTRALVSGECRPGSAPAQHAPGGRLDTSALAWCRTANLFQIEEAVCCQDLSAKR